MEVYTDSGTYDRGLLGEARPFQNSLGTSKETTFIPLGYPIFVKRPVLQEVRILSGSNYTNTETGPESERP